MAELRIVPTPLPELDKLAQDARDHAELTRLLESELAMQDAEMVAHPLSPTHDYPLYDLKLVEKRKWSWLAQNWRKWAGPLTGMLAIAASAAAVIAIAFIVWGIL